MDYGECDNRVLVENMHEELAKHEFRYVEQAVEKLKKVTDIVHVASRDASSRNGFEATQSVRLYERNKEKYGQ